VQPWVRQDQAGLVELPIFEEQQIEVDRPRTARPACPDTTELGLDPEQGLEKLAGGEGRLEAGGAVQEPRLVGHRPDRIGLDQPRDALDGHAR
jgi:hypothetical protein